MRYCSVNYQKVNTISVLDRGLAYGDGVFTTGKVVAGQVEMLSAHLERLKIGCHKLAIIAPDFIKLAEQVKAVTTDFSLAVLKIVITAGIGGRGYSRHRADKATVIISLFDFPEHYFLWQQQGINLGVSKHKLGLNPMLAGIKHLNRLEQVLIRQELDHRAEDDLLVLDLNNHVIESSCANVFWLANGTWQTPKITTAGIAGLMRAKILTDIHDIDLVDVSLSYLSELAKSSKLKAMFICNSVMGVVPIKAYNQQLLSLSAVNLFSGNLR